MEQISPSVKERDNMTCPTCNGRGFVRDWCRQIGMQTARGEVVQQSALLFVPCPDCNGDGIEHCYEGLREQVDEQ